jgi:hypothetical protein
MARFRSVVDLEKLQHISSFQGAFLERCVAIDASSVDPAAGAIKYDDASGTVSLFIRKSGKNALVPLDRSAWMTGAALADRFRDQESGYLAELDHALQMRCAPPLPDLHVWDLDVIKRACAGNNKEQEFGSVSILRKPWDPLSVEYAVTPPLRRPA